MKANELRIGNYVEGESGYVYPFELSDFYDWYNDHNSHLYGDSVKPIPITEEWLLKFGFVPHPPDTDSFYPYYWRKTIRINYKENKWYIAHHAVYIHYVHELQNLYFALIGEELIIN